MYDTIAVLVIFILIDVWIDQIANELCFFKHSMVPMAAITSKASDVLKVKLDAREKVEGHYVRLLLEKYLVCTSKSQQFSLYIMLASLKKMSLSNRKIHFLYYSNYLCF